jgi:hypothetical protein
MLVIGEQKGEEGETIGSTVCVYMHAVGKGERRGEPSDIRSDPSDGLIR